MNKNLSAIIGLTLAVCVACSSSASATKNDRPAAPVSATSVTPRSLAVTVPKGPDEPVKVTITTTTTTTTVVVAQPPETIPSDLLFAVDSARLSDEAEPILARILSAAKGKVVSIHIDAHTDSDADESYNMALAQRRGDTVADWFVRHGVPQSLITVTSWGETRPLVPNDTPAHKAMNRRVELTIQVGR